MKKAFFMFSLSFLCLMEFFPRSYSLTIGHGRSKVGKWKFHNSYHPILYSISECRTLQPGPKLIMTCFTLYRKVSEVDAGCESLNTSWQVSMGAPWVCLPHISAPAWNQELLTMTQVFRREKWTCDIQVPPGTVPVDNVMCRDRTGTAFNSESLRM